MTDFSEPSPPVTRDFTVAVFVVWRAQVLLHKHRKLNMWLPPGGHIEPNELPDEAALREVLEEAGVQAELVGDLAVHVDEPRQLVRPRGVQLESISPGHEHIDLVYLARPLEPYDGRLVNEDTPFCWYTLEQALGLDLTPELVAWVQLALREVSG